MSGGPNYVWRASMGHGPLRCGCDAGNQASEREGTGHPLGVDQQHQAQHGQRQPGNDRCRQQRPGTRCRKDGPRAMLPLTARALSVMSTLRVAESLGKFQRLLQRVKLRSAAGLPSWRPA